MTRGRKKITLHAVGIIDKQNGLLTDNRLPNL